MKNFKKTLKLIFIPHEHNDYKPHFFRESSILSIIIVVIVLLSTSAGTIFYIKNTDMAATVLPAVLVDLTNEARLKNNEFALTRNPILDEVARLKAEDMARLGYFAHTSPTGITPWYWFNKMGYYFVYAGENLAINFTESIDVENAWLNSPTHKANILNDKFTEIGIATVEGIYQGRPTTYVVQMFGKPSIVTNIEIKVISPTIKTTTPLVKNPKITTVPKTTIPATIAVAPVVKGESIVENQNFEILIDTKDFIAVKNNTAVVGAEPTIVDINEKAPKYSSWQDRFIFMTPAYTDRAYRVFIWVILIALALMTFIEIRRQHPRNIIYGLLLLVIIICLVYINKAMID